MTPAMVAAEFAEIDRHPARPRGPGRGMGHPVSDAAPGRARRPRRAGRRRGRDARSRPRPACRARPAPRHADLEVGAVPAPLADRRGRQRRVGGHTCHATVMDVSRRRHAGFAWFTGWVATPQPTNQAHWRPFDMHRVLRRSALSALLFSLLAGSAASVSAASPDGVAGYVYVNDNAAVHNSVAGFARHRDGTPDPARGIAVPDRRRRHRQPDRLGRRDPALARPPVHPRRRRREQRHLRPAGRQARVAVAGRHDRFRTARPR